VRELENACERIAQTCSCGTVRVGCMAPAILFHASAQPAPFLPPIDRTSAPATSAPPMPFAHQAMPGTTVPGGTASISLDDRVREFEAGLIAWALRISRGNKSKAATLLQIKRSTLGDRINRCGIQAPHEEERTA